MKNYKIVAVLLVMLYCSCMLPFTAYTVLSMDTYLQNTPDIKVTLYFNDLRRVNKNTGYTKLTASFGTSVNLYDKIHIQSIEVTINNEKYLLLNSKGSDILLEGNGYGINRRYNGYWTSGNKILVPYEIADGGIKAIITYKVVGKTNNSFIGSYEEIFRVKRTEGRTPLISH